MKTPKSLAQTVRKKGRLVVSKDKLLSLFPETTKDGETISHAVAVREFCKDNALEKQWDPATGNTILRVKQSAD